MSVEWSSQQEHDLVTSFYALAGTQYRFVIVRTSGELVGEYTAHVEERNSPKRYSLEHLRSAGVGASVNEWKLDDAKHACELVLSYARTHQELPDGHAGVYLVECERLDARAGARARE